MLRLGAAVNTISAVQSWLSASNQASGIAGKRDLVCGFLVAAAFLKEAIDGLLRPNYAEIVRLARKDGTPEDVIQSLGDLMSKKPHGLYMRLLLNARNKLVFHWEEEAFQKWAGRYDEPNVVWAAGDGTADDFVFVAARQALLDSVIPGASETEIHSRINEVFEASGLLVGVFRKAIHAYLEPYIA